MRIQTNVTALNAWRSLNQSSNALGKSLEKLSSGYRLNRAADDAAGLAISEKMRAQIRGLNQAVRNAQDGISLLQTAEGALSETHSILQRMRELADQATSEINTTDERREIQKEIEALKSEIDRVADTTEFNAQKLINGSLGASANSSAPANVSVISATGLQKGTYLVEIDTAATQAVLTGDVAYADDAAVATAFTTDKDITINGFQIDTSGVDTQDKLLVAINARTADTGVVASWTGNNITLTTVGYGSSQSIALGGSDAALLNGAAAVTAGVDAVATVTYTDPDNVVKETPNLTAAGRNLIFQGAEFELKTAAGTSATVNVLQVGIVFQIGANEGQDMLVDVNEMSTKTLGNATNKVADVSVLTTDGAKQAITTLNDAIKQVSSERSKMGAFQNRLEHTINNLNVSAENLTAAESRIRDVDMANEMMQFTKSNILLQAGTAMLAQANATPQSALRLLSYERRVGWIKE